MSRQPFEDEVLLKLVKNKTYAEQADLQVALKNSGVDMPQATLSRRLKKLNIVKLNGVYQIVKQQESSLVTNIIEVAPNLIIIKTLPGHAGSVAYTIDCECDFDISGTIAGDDTIFIASNHVKTTYKQLVEFFQKKE